MIIWGIQQCQLDVDQGQHPTDTAGSPITHPTGLSDHDGGCIEASSRLTRCLLSAHDGVPAKQNENGHVLPEVL